MRGTPQIYYGTEILMRNRGSDNHGLIRSDFPGGFAGDKVNGFAGTGLSAREREAQAWLAKLLQWRRGSEVIHHGALVHFVPQGDGAYVYFRSHGERRVMVAFNKTKKRVRLPSARFAEQLRGRTHGREVLSGRRVEFETTLTIPPRAVLIVEVGE